MKKLLMLGITFIAVGCSKLPEDYHRAALNMAEDLCEGKVMFSSDGDTRYPLVTSASIVEHYSYKYTCVSDKGSLSQEIKYKDIPVKYFEGE